ncbi:DUF3616 domain-containing protein [Vitiosangium sp. GDMCC 1.1324]|uniref:DUF3616 domain-containing protein n=1 Tax=Vitiosangium sp. (strain GDMCC 1.1324) TaxID=2138576 RepID=UPI000D34C498|nr:DUF3616 domain-containing protein [Vitiosangium sp. GDMCC 1.1324]PTL84336.1 DUF3616 domain-containing protein [Vitiosangium sp. GDMCC 1.1324]
MLKTAFVMTAVLGSSPGDRPPSPPTTKVVTFEGACDASGAVVQGKWSFTVADDEDNIIRVYDGKTGGRPIRTTDLSSSLGLSMGKKGAPETDIEAATEIPPLSFWLSSHGRKSSGKLDTNRFRFFATRTSRNGTVQLEGKPYTQLLDDLLAAPQLAAFDLASASKRAPKAEGGLNIEGMTAMEDGKSVLIGFRNPLPEGKALTIVLLNPAELPQGKPARLGAVRLLDFGGLGIRSISRWKGRYLFIAGPTSGQGGSRLFTWDGKAERPTLVESADFTDLNPEAFVTFEDKEEILALSDDGTRLLDGVECKRLQEPEKKRFRGVWLRLPPKS